jgi:predicted nucleic acid-binding protein
MTIAIDPSVIVAALVDTGRDGVWALRKSITNYDAWYVALAEALNCSLATLDIKLKNASGARCAFAVP